MEDMMYFTFDVETTILIKAWKVETIAGLIGSCIVVFFIAFLFEWIKVLRSKLEASLIADLQGEETTAESTETSHILEKDDDSPPLLHPGHALQTILHVLQLAVAYALMLIVMTYNGWLTMSVLLGAGFGYYFFGWMTRANYTTRNKKK
ncbi:protein SLC31A2-like [Apostichopus japonicus]|uniref:protein SLC31A2-like n=1 Tax=Stichopus japonicus TaxID=307972 RepID=UPI003AB88B17